MKGRRILMPSTATAHLCSKHLSMMRRMRKPKATFLPIESQKTRTGSVITLILCVVQAMEGRPDPNEPKQDP